MHLHKRGHKRKRKDETHRARRVIKTEVYSRIVGYLRPVQNWNKAKVQEFADRVTYRMPNEGE